MSQPPENQQQYGSILTILGENAEQNGKLKNKQITFTHVAIGDANDQYVQPDRKQTALVNELARIPVNSVDVLQPTPDSTPMLKVEAILPDDVNDLIIREFAAVATFDGNTYFHAVGNCARIYVPAPVNNGNVSTPVTLEMIFVITSADPIVEMDPNVVTASREYVNYNVQKSESRTLYASKWPANGLNAKVGDVIDGYVEYVQFNGVNYPTPIPVTGEITGLNIIDKPYTITVGGVTTYLLNGKHVDSHRVNLKSMWCEVDGVTDDTVCANATLELARDLDLPAFKPKGDMLVTATLKAYTDFYSKKGWIKGDVESFDVVKYVNVNDVEVRLKIDGMAEPEILAKGKSLLRFEGCDNITVKNGDYENSSFRCLSFLNCDNVEVVKNRWGNSHTGCEFLLTDNKTHKTFSVRRNKAKRMAGCSVIFQPYIDQTPGSEVSAGQFEDVEMLNNRSVDCYYFGLEVYGRCDDVRIGKNYSERCGVNSSFGDAMTHGGIVFKHSKNGKIYNNVSLHCFKGIEVISNNQPTSNGYRVSNLKVTDNISEGDYVQSDSGVIVYYACDDLVLHRNKSKGFDIGMSITSYGDHATNYNFEDNDCYENKIGMQFQCVNGGTLQKLVLKKNNLYNNNRENETHTSRSGLHMQGEDASSYRDVEIRRNRMYDTTSSSVKQIRPMFIECGTNIEVEKNFFEGNTEDKIRAYLGENIVNLMQIENSDLVTDGKPLSGGDYSNGDRGRVINPGAVGYLGYVFHNGAFKYYGAVEQ